MNSNAQISQDLKDLNPKIKFLKEKTYRVEIYKKMRTNYMFLVTTLY